MSFATICPVSIVNRALDGDAEAFGKIYDLYKQAVYGLAYRMLQNPDNASDILQQVFEKVMTRLQDVDDHAKLGSWIKRITYNCVIDFIRDSSREIVDIDSFSNLSHLSYSDSLERFDLNIFLKCLSPRERTVLVLFSIENYSHEEIARSLNISESNSKKIYSRTLKKLSRIAQLERYSGKKVE